MIGYLKINSMKNKLADLRVIQKYLSLDYLVLSNSTYLTLDGYEIRRRRDRNKFGEGLI